MSGPRFLVPSVVSDSIVERENCILFTQRLQYATFPLYSLQLTTHSTCRDTESLQRHTEHARSDERKHTHKLSSRLKAFPPPSLSFCSSAVTFCPDMSLKSVTGSGGVISATLCLQTGRRDRGRGGNDELELDQAYKLILQGRVTFSCGIMEAAYCLSSLQATGLQVVFFFLSVTHGQEIWAWPWAQSHPRSLDVMAVCRGTNRWISDQNTGAVFPFRFLRSSPSLFSITPPPVSVFLPRSDSFSHSGSLPTTPSLLPPERLTRVSRLRDPTVGCSDKRENFFYFIRVSHLCTPPIECEIGGVG